MTVLVFAAPYTPPPPPLAPFRGYQVIWTGWDGSVWDLTDWRNSGVCLVEDITGLHTPIFDDYTSKSPFTPGQRYKGGRAQPRALAFNLLIYSDTGSEEWERINDAFWFSMRPDLPGTLTIISPSGKRREIQARYTPQSAHTFARDPAKDGWTLYQPDLTADYPYYLGPVIDAFSWEAPGDPLPFIPDTGGPPFNISNVTSAVSATVSNPGDVARYLTWIITGELDARISVAGGVINPPVVGPDQVLTIETTPERASAVLVDTETGETEDAWASVTTWDPRRLPVGTDVPVGLELVGAGKIQAVFRPAYFRAT